jgi:hypothetical protein
MMYQKQKVLAMDSENLAKIYILEIKRVSLFWGGRGDQKRGPQNIRAKPEGY